MIGLLKKVSNDIEGAEMRVRFRVLVLLVACSLLPRGELRAQGPPANPIARPYDVNVPNSAPPDVEVNVSTEDGKPIAIRVVVQLINQNGQLYDQPPGRKATP